MNRYFIVLAITSLTAYQIANGAEIAAPQTRGGCSLSGIASGTLNFCRAAPSNIARAFTSCRRRNENGSHGKVDLRVGYKNWLSNPSVDDLELYEKGRLEDMEAARMPWGHLVRLGFWLGLAAVILHTCPDESVTDLGARLCGLFGWIEAPRNAKATRVRKEIRKIRDIVDKKKQGTTVSHSTEESYRILQRLSENDILTPLSEMLCKKGLCANAFTYHRDRKRLITFIVGLLNQHGHKIPKSLIRQYLGAVEKFNEHFQIAKRDFYNTTTQDNTERQEQLQKAADYLIQHLANNNGSVPVIKLITAGTFEDVLDLYLADIFKENTAEKERCRKAILAIKPLEYSELTINITTETNSTSSSSSSSSSVPTTPETPNLSSGNSLLSNQGTAGLSPLRLPEPASTAAAQDIELATV